MIWVLLQLESPWQRTDAILFFYLYLCFSVLGGFFLKKSLKWVCTFRNCLNYGKVWRGGHGGLRYCGIELFFKRYFGNFDFNVRYYGIIQSCGMRFFTAFWLTVLGKRKSFTVLRYCSFGLSYMSNVGQYLEEFRLNGKWIHNLWQLLYDKIGRTSNDLAFRWLYRSIWDLLTVFREGWGWFLVYPCLR